MAEIKAMVRDEDESNPTPKLGDTVFLLHWTWEWLPATVVDRIAAEHNEGVAATYPPPHVGTLHLCLKLNPERHFSAGTYAYRPNAVEGLAEGQWQREAPANWEAAKADHEYRADVEKETRLKVWAESAGA